MIHPHPTRLMCPQVRCVCSISLDYLVDEGVRRTGGGQEEGVVTREGDGEHQVEGVQPQLDRDVLEDGQEDRGRGGVTHQLIEDGGCQEDQGQDGPAGQVSEAGHLVT